MKDTITVDIPVSAETVSRTINLPAYRKDEYQVTKVIDERTKITVYSYGSSFGITKGNYKDCGIDILTSRDFMDCSAEEFEKAFEAVQDRISQLSIEHA